VGADHTPHQRKAIERFYRNREQREAQRLEELVGEIWLARGEAQRARLWARAAQILARTRGLDAAEVERVLAARDVEGLAALAGQKPGDAPPGR
jgi:hypothetical protein